MTEPWSRRLSGFAAACALVAAAWAVRALLEPSLGEHHPYGTFLVAVLLAAWFWGTAPAILALVLGTLLADVFFVPPVHGIGIPEVEHQVGLVLFLVVGITGILASRALRRAERQATASQEQALLRGTELESEVEERRHAESALRASEQRFRNLAQSVPQLVWTARSDGTITFLNQRWTEYTDLTPAMVSVLDDMTAGFHPDDSPEVLSCWRESLATGQPHEVQCRLGGDQGYRWFLMRMVPAIDEGGEIREWFGTATDIDAQKQIEEELRRNEARLRLALDAGRMGIWERDVETDGVVWDAKQHELWGFDAANEVITGAKLLERVHPEDAARVRQATTEALETGKFWVEFRIRTGDGRERWLASKGGVVRDPSGRVVRLIGVNFDVTESRQAEEALRRSEQLYRAIGESIDYGIWVCDAEGRNVYASQSFLDLVGLTQEQCSEFGWGRVLHPDDADATIAAWQECARSGDFWEREHRFLGVDGEWHHVLARGVPIRDDSGRVAYWAGINLDLSDIKGAQQALMEADRRKDEFLATLAHELRNPLAPLRNGMELLRLSGSDERKFEEIRTMMERQVHHLVRLVDDLLDVSRITKGKIELRKERVDVRDIVRNAVDTVQPALDARGQTLGLHLGDEPSHVEADAIRLTQVFSNLLDNASKFSPSGGHIAVSARRESDGMVVAVSDAGMGIPNDSLESVFELFSQVDRSLDRVAGGLGIGLSLVRGLVELHGGTVEARSDGTGHGSEFVVQLPFAPSATASPEPRPGERQAVSSRRRILVVDDNRDSAESLALVLQSLGHEVRAAFDGLTAISLARELEPECILLDIGMPGLDGYETARRMRDARISRNAIYVAMTGWGQEEDKKRSEREGFDAHLTKPVDLAALQRLLARAADSSLAQRDRGV